MSQPSTRAPRRDAQANRGSILAAARTALAHDPGASIDHIARAAGLTRRALYGHFEDRSALIREVIATGAQRFNALAEQETSDDAQLALAQLAARLWQETTHVRVGASMALDDAHVADTAAALAPLRTVVADIVTRGQRDGVLRTDLSVETLAHLIEETARMVVVRDLSPAGDTGSVAIRAVLGIAGLSWREADALLTAHPELTAVGMTGIA